MLSAYTTVSLASIKISTHSASMKFPFHLVTTKNLVNTNKFDRSTSTNIPLGNNSENFHAQQQHES